MELLQNYDRTRMPSFTDVDVMDKLTYFLI